MIVENAVKTPMRK